MQVSAEIRWFWEIEPVAVREWFVDPAVHGFEISNPEKRTDSYLHGHGHAELGIKQRGKNGGVEIKGLVAARDAQVMAGPLTGRVQIWTKWTSKALDLPDLKLVSIEKTRWLRKFQVKAGAVGEVQADAFPPIGCNVEFTEIVLGQTRAFSLGFEAFGPLDAVEPSLHATLRELASRNPPVLTGGTETSYPEWLSWR